MALLEVKNLEKRYATQKAVDDISFSIEAGQIFGLLGPNGAGKSTLLRMVTGIFYPDGGQVILDGKVIRGLEHAHLIGYMPEERGLYKKMKVGEQVMYLAQLKGLSKTEASERAKDWFDRLGMSTWWDKKMEDLSKGMGQKLQFVVTVIHNPKLLILDEPFSGLDPVNANVIKDEIYRLAKLGTTIIFSTHRMEQVEEICDQIMLINKGQKLLDGDVASVKQRFKQNIFSVRFNDGFDEQLIPNGVTLLKTENNNGYFKLDEGMTANQVLQFYINNGKQIVHFDEHLPSLNDIFIQLVGNTPTAREFDN